MGFGQRDSVPSQLTGEAVVNQFRQLCENDGKGTEGYQGSLFPYLFSRFRTTDGIDSPQLQQCEGTNLSIQIPFRVFRDFPYVPLFLFWIYSANFRYWTLVTTGLFRIAAVLVTDSSSLPCAAQESSETIPRLTA